MATAAWLSSTVVAHAWNADRSMLAISPNTNEVWIYTGCKNADTSKWERKWVLTEHDMLVCAMDWHPVTNKLVTCGHDRSAFVWTLGETGWKPSVSILRINRAATHVRWSPDGRKFAVASGSKLVSVCWYDSAGDWWIGQQTKRSKSTVTAVAWHPSGQVLASAATDYKVRVYSVYYPEVDGKQDAAQFGALPEFGESIIEFEQTKAWVNDVAWSPSGSQLGFVGHDGLLHVVQFAPGASAPPTVQTVKTTGLPAMRLLWLSEKAIVTGGHNNTPEVFALGGGGFWSIVGSLDKREDAAAAKAGSSASAFQGAKNIFAAKVGKGMSTPMGGEDAPSATKHTSTITDMCLYSGTASTGFSKLSTSGLDGRVVIWDLAAAGMDLAALGISAK